MIPVLTNAQSLRWSRLPAIPDPVGFAGSVAGISNGALLVGGGANFPDNVGPWGKTPKTWYDAIFALEKENGTWKKVGKLPRKMGYSLALTVPDGVLCIGGADADRHYADVILLTYRQGRVTTETLSPLPRPLANACGAVLNGVVYLAGGLETPSDTTAENVFLSLDLNRPNARWETLPAWPGPGRMLAVAGAQDGKFFLFSGTEVFRDPPTGTIKRRYLSDAYAYDPGQKTWSRLADLPHPAVAAPSPAFPVGKTDLLVPGGDDGSNAERNLILKENHPGFRPEILAYHTLTNTWTLAGAVAPDPNAVPDRPDTQDRWAPVTTPAVVWNGKLVLPGGEVRPGRRTNRVLVASPTKP